MLRAGRHRSIAAIACLCGNLAGVAATVAAPEHWQAVNEEIRLIRETRSVALSPDGRHVLATISDPTSAGGQPHLWLLDTTGGAPRQLTFSSGRKKGEEHAQWEPDGQAIYFTSHRENVAHVYRLPAQGGEAVELALSRSQSGMPRAAWVTDTADDRLDVDSLQVSPDSRVLAVIAQDFETKHGDGGHEKDDAIRVDGNLKRHRLYLVEVSGATVREVPLPDNVRDVRWSPAGGQLAVLTSSDSDDLGPSTRVWLVGREAGAEIRQLSTTPPTTRRVEWNPDGRELALLAQCEHDAPPGCTDVYLQNLHTGGVRNLTATLAGSVAAELAFDRTGALVTTVRVGLRERIARIDAASGRIDWIDGPESVTASIATNPRRDGWALMSTGAARPMSPFWTPVLGRPARALNVPDMVPDTWKPVTGIPVMWRNAGLDIEGLLYLPPMSEKVRVPLIVHVHGGPSYLFQDRFYALVNLLVARGWAVLQPNPRGSQGYGAAFLAANKDDLGGEDYRDIIAGVDTVIRQYPIDTSRLALVGYSYGGTMAAFTVGRTDRFRAVVSGAPVIDQFSEYGEEDSSWFDRWYFGQPWQRFEEVWRQSPLSTVGNTRTPVLLFQGAADITDPPTQSLELYRSFRQLGVPAELVVYPREDHIELHHNFYGEPSREPWHGIDLRRRMIEFIAHAFDELKKTQ